ncbi:MAG: hypothetical protein KDA37_17670, partial [Planctomycetales bacterium]|nr:hypothetical protein [Planctomycetales bacterium]
DDFNTGGAIAELFELAKIANRVCDTNDLEGKGKENSEAVAEFTATLTAIKELSSILGIFQQPPAEAGGSDNELLGRVMQPVIDLRAESRQAKNFTVADAIRDGLKPTGITLEDRSGGTEWEGGSDEALNGVMQMLIDLRADARKNKDFATGDAVRDRLKEAGVTLEDRAGGTEWTT